MPVQMQMKVQVEVQVNTCLKDLQFFDGNVSSLFFSWLKEVKGSLQRNWCMRIVAQLIKKIREMSIEGNLTIK